MQGLRPVLRGDALLQIEDVGHLFGIPRGRFGRNAGPVFFDRAEGFDDQDGMMRDDRAAAFGNEHRVLDLFGVAHIHDVPHNIPRVFGEGVVHGAFVSGAGAIVVHPEAASHIDVAHGMPHFA